MPHLSGEALNATAAFDLFFLSTPGVTAFFMRINHPLPGQDPELSPEASFGGYPCVRSPSGIIVADDAPLPDAVANGAEPFLVVGAMAGG